MAQKSDERIAAAAAARARKAEIQKAAAEQAYKDSMAQPEPPDASGVKPGQQVPLHILNTRAKTEDRRLKNARLDASKAAARAVHDSLATQGQDAAAAKRKAKTVAGPNTVDKKAANPPSRKSAGTRPKPTT